MSHAFEESSENLVALERLVDKTSLVQVIEGLALICHGKAEHLATNWQDVQTAKRWTTEAKRLNRVAMFVRV